MSSYVLFGASLIFPAAMIWAGLVDLTTMKIRNALVLFLLAAYAVMAPLAGLGITTIGSSFVAALAVFACAFTFFAFGWIGGGDAKLATVAALWLGSDQVLAFVVGTAVFGGVLTLAILQIRAFPLPASWYTQPWIERLHAPATGIPYGVAMAAAALVVFPDTVWMAGL